MSSEWDESLLSAAAVRSRFTWPAAEVQTGKVEDPLLVAITELGRALIATEQRWLQAVETQEAYRLQAADAAADVRNLTDSLEREKGKTAMSINQHTHLLEFVRNVAGGSNEGKPRSRAQIQARELLNEIGWTIR